MNILYATDGSEDARTAGELLCHFEWGHGDRLTVLTVVQNFVLLSGRIDSEVESWRNLLNDEETRAADEILKETATRLGPFFPQVETRVHLGFPAHEILCAAGEIQADLIVMGSQGLSALKEWFIGSVSHSVLEKAGCSVLVGRALNGPLSEVTLAYDGSTESEAALQWVQRLPLREGLRVDVIAVAVPAPLPASGLLMGWPGGYDALYNEVQEAQNKAATELAAKAVDTLQSRGLSAHPYVCTGDPAHEIVRVSKEQVADLVVIGAHSRQGWIRDLLGNTTRGVLKGLACSMLVARSGKAHHREWWDTTDSEAVSN